MAEYEGEFVADASDGGFLKGTQWLVWKFESDATLADACQVRRCRLTVLLLKRLPSAVQKKRLLA